MFGCLKSQQNQTILNKGTEDELACVGYQKSPWRMAIYIFLCISSLGIVWLLCWWVPEWGVKLTSFRCSLKKADTLVLQDETGNVFIEEVHCEVIGQRKGHKEYSTFKLKESISPSNKGTDQSGGGDYFFNESKTTRESAILENERCMVRYFEHHHVRHAWNEASSSFEMLSGLSQDTTCKDIMEKFDGLNVTTRSNRLTLYGLNQLVIDVRSYCQLLFQEVLNPFYIFQVFSICLWIWEKYFIYAGCIFFISLISLCVQLFETRKQQISLRNTVMTDDITVNVFPPGGQETTEVMSSMLVPGDLIHVPVHCLTMPCDVVLVSGSAVVDEGMLTGESLPVTKLHLTDESSSEIYSPISHKKNTIFCGTKVLQTRFYGNAKVKAVVVRTGYSTMKGELVRMILFPKPIKFSFYADALRFVFFLALLALLGFVYILVFLTIHEFSIKERIQKALDVITVAVPPALPAAMTVGIIYAQARLKRSQIFCISPQRINLCGKINCLCFDKTGTLTQDGLDLWGVVGVNKSEVKVGFQEPIRDPTTMPHGDPFVIGMATCHSLTQLHGNVCGDPLDLKMFESVNWLLEEQGSESTKYDTLIPTIVKPITTETYMLDDEEENKIMEVAVLKQFTFDSSLQRMNVVVRITSSDHMTTFTKGSPEKIISICVPSSVPSDFNEVLRKYTGRGHRVVAMATKDLEKSVTWHHVHRLPRDSVEKDLTFLGLLIMENKLKPESTPVLKHLNEAEIRTVMITGDNILTALCVARQCNIVDPNVRVIQVDAFPPENGRRARIIWQLDEDIKVRRGSTYHIEPLVRDDESEEKVESISLDNSKSHDQSDYQLAIGGRSYSVLCQYFPELLPKIVTKGAIFARMTPDQKSSVIENLQKLGLTVGMCGDGANDCGALRTSHAGISLSQMEASVAAPFTSKVDNISCVPIVIREGRGSLVTSFGVFKFMALYSIIQFVSVIILSTRFSKLTDPMYLYIDLFIITVLALTIGKTEPSTCLSKSRPRSRLASSSNLVGISIHIAIVIAFQLVAVFYVMSQPWYKLEPIRKTENRTLDMTCVFYVSTFQYLTMAYIFSKGPPFRKRMWSNVFFLSSLVILTVTSVINVMSPWNISTYVFDVKEIPSTTFKLCLLSVSMGNFVLTCILEEIVLESNLYRSICKRIFHKLKTPPPYKMILQELNESPDWPPIGQVTWSMAVIDQSRIRLPSN